MPNWEGIEDASPSPARVWLCREKNGDEWKPLRKADCRSLNNSNTGTKVLIEGGRAMADPAKGVISYNFDRSPDMQLTSATWFVKEEKSSKEVLLVPLASSDADLVEGLYQRAISATSSLGEGIDSVLKEEVVLADDDRYRIVVMKNASNVLSMKKKPKGWFGGTAELQRGYGEYVIDGEEEEMSLGPVSHIVFVVHGIGEALWSRPDNKIMCIVDETKRTRTILQKKQVADWKKECEKAKKAGNPEPAPPNRIEFLPVEWYEHIHSSSNALMKSLKASTLRTIPALRAIANDVVFDVLMYMTPKFCESVLESVTNQIEELFNRYTELHPDFLARGGKCGLVGHSLGSVICWDLLSVLKDFSQPKDKRPNSDDGSILPFGLCGVTIPSDHDAAVGYQAYAVEDDANEAKNGTWGPSLPKRMKRTIPFVPDFTIFVGSPIGLFLTLRGAHAVFDEMRVAAVQVAQEQAAKVAAEQAEGEEQNKETSVSFPVASPFTLPSGAIFNIFHPSDPVAYRIEPLLLAQETCDADLPAPAFLVKQGQSVRFHVKAKQIGDEIRKSFAAQTNNWSNLLSQMTEQAVSALSSLADEEDGPRRQLRGSVSLRPGPMTFPLGGKSDRVDFQLQTGVIDNEYFSAVTAHATYSYFSNKDFLEFMVGLTEEKEETKSASEPN